MNKDYKFYQSLGNWDFSDIKYEEVPREDEFEYFKWIRQYVKSESKCLDLGTGGGEKLLKYYPKVHTLIGIDYSPAMIKTAKENLEKSNRKDENISFIEMDISDLKFEDNSFDIVTARHTEINSKEIKRVLKPNGILIIEGVAKDDCLELKEMVGRGQCFFDEIAIEKIEEEELKKSGFEFIENKMMILDEYYLDKNNLFALLLKTPIVENITEDEWLKINEYVKLNETKDGKVKLKRRIYGFICLNTKK